MPLSAEKAVLRRQYLAVRRQMDPARKAMLDAEITNAVLENLRYRSAKTLLLYVSLPYEVDTHALLDRAWAEGRAVALPRCGKTGEMDFFLVQSSAELAVGAWGISEPNGSCPLYVPDTDDLCIVPGLAFDCRGFRLGHGGGYYDRYLARNPMPTLGLCYPGFRPACLPAEPFDIRITQVLFGSLLQGGTENA